MPKTEGENLDRKMKKIERNKEEQGKRAITKKEARQDAILMPGGRTEATRNKFATKS